MKTLQEYLTEKEKEGPRPLAKNEGADDQEFFEVMEHYKNYSRHEDHHELARQFRDHATHLRKNGDVSDNAKIAGAYS